MGNSTSNEVKHLALLGDSTLDNGGWVGKGPSVIEQVCNILPQSTLCAKDGALMAAIETQAAHIPKHTSHIVVSIGGNNCFDAMNTLDRKVQTVAEGFELFSKFIEAFEKEYMTVIQWLRAQYPDASIVLCSVYNPCFGPFGVRTLSQPTANLGIALLTDVITRVATKMRMPMIDWRRVMVNISDFANPIEPSSEGGAKMAQCIVDVIRKHPFDKKVSIIYPQEVPISEITRDPSSTLVPRDDAKMPREEDPIQTANTSNNSTQATNVSEVPTSAAKVEHVRSTATV